MNAAAPVDVDVYVDGIAMPSSSLLSSLGRAASSGLHEPRATPTLVTRRSPAPNPDLRKRRRRLR